MLRKVWTKALILSGDRFLRTGFWLTIANLMGGVLGYVYQILIGRMLSLADFALFSAVMALYAIFSAPLTAVFMVVSRQVTIFMTLDGVQQLKSYYWKTLKNSLLLAIPFLILGIIFSQNISVYIKAETEYPVWAFLLMLVLTLLLVINNAFFQGCQKFILLASTTLGGIFLKIILSIGLIYIGYKANGALIGVVLSIATLNIIGFFLNQRTLERQTSKAGPSVALPEIKKNVIPVLFANLGFVAMTQLDMILVNWFFPPDQAGSYAAASVFGKAVLYLPGGLVLALFPLVVEKHANNDGSINLLINAILTTVLMCGSVALIYYLFGPELISLVYGERYPDAGSILSWYGFAILPMALVMVAEHYLIAKGQTLFCWLLIGILPIQLLFIWYWHEQVWMILLSVGISGSFLMLLGFYLLFRKQINLRFKLSHQ